MSLNKVNKQTGETSPVAGLGGSSSVRNFELSASNWTANSDVSTSTDYPYIYTISTDKYSDNSYPIWDLNGAGTVPTSTERDSINMILEAVFSSTGIILYATDLPTEDLVLRVKGA